MAFIKKTFKLKPLKIEAFGEAPKNNELGEAFVIYPHRELLYTQFTGPNYQCCILCRKVIGRLVNVKVKEGINMVIYF